jgi:hypothetical protein
MVSLKAVSEISPCLVCGIPEAILLIINVGFDACAVNRRIKVSMVDGLHHG